MSIRKDDQGRRIDEHGNLLPPHRPLGGDGFSRPKDPPALPVPEREPDHEPVPAPAPKVAWPSTGPKSTQNPLLTELQGISRKLDILIGLLKARAEKA